MLPVAWMHIFLLKNYKTNKGKLVARAQANCRAAQAQYLLVAKLPIYMRSFLSSQIRQL